MSRLENANTTIMTVAHLYPPRNGAKKGQIASADFLQVMEIWARDFRHYKVGETYLITFNDFEVGNGTILRTAVRAERLERC